MSLTTAKRAVTDTIAKDILKQLKTATKANESPYHTRPTKDRQGPL